MEEIGCEQGSLTEGIGLVQLTPSYDSKTIFIMTILIMTILIMTILIMTILIALNTSDITYN
jgi:hypothetical protein